MFTTENDPPFQEFERSDAPRDVLLDIAEQILLALERERGLAVGFGGATSDIATRGRYVSLVLDGLNPDRAQPLPSSPADPERGSH